MKTIRTLAIFLVFTAVACDSSSAPTAQAVPTVSAITPAIPVSTTTGSATISLAGRTEVTDVNGNLVAYLLGLNGNYATIYNIAASAVQIIDIWTGLQIDQSGYLFYTTTNCTGTAYVSSSAIAPKAQIKSYGQYFEADAYSVAGTNTMQSTLFGATCYTSSTDSGVQSGTLQFANGQGGGSYVGMVSLTSISAPATLAGPLTFSTGN